ncbi:MAG: hypothetical protein WAW62_00680 [Candidatus Saccharimonas aalborgensis]
MTQTMNYKELLANSNEFFGSFMSMNRNIWFKKYRTHLHARYEFDDRKAVLWFNILVLGWAYGLIIAMAITVLLLSFSFPSEYWAQNKWWWQLLYIFMLAVYYFYVIYIIWPYSYDFLSKRGVVKKK